MFQKKQKLECAKTVLCSYWKPQRVNLHQLELQREPDPQVLHNILFVKSPSWGFHSRNVVMPKEWTTSAPCQNLSSGHWIPWNPENRFDRPDCNNKREGNKIRPVACQTLFCPVFYCVLSILDITLHREEKKTTFRQSCWNPNYLWPINPAQFKINTISIWFFNTCKHWFLSFSPVYIHTHTNSNSRKEMH